MGYVRGDPPSLSLITPSAKAHPDTLHAPQLPFTNIHHRNACSTQSFIISLLENVQVKK